MLENQLISKCQNGDGEAFRQLINNYRNKLYGYIWRFSDSSHVAEELFQETLIKVWKGLKKYNDQKKFSSWLFTIAHNVAMDSLRTKKKNLTFTSLELIEKNKSVLGPDEDIIEKEEIDQIEIIVNSLSVKQREVFLLRQHGEMSFKEIAELTGQPLNTVLSHMRYAVQKIKKKLENENETRKRTSAESI